MCCKPPDTASLITCRPSQSRSRPFELAGLFHDLGHLPFSHDFESALNLYRRSGLTPDERADSPLAALVAKSRGRYAFHETLGQGLALLLFQESFGTDLHHAVFSLAYDILEAPPSPVFGQLALQAKRRTHRFTAS